VCGPWQRDPDDEHTVTNPVVLVEVLSSTAAYDRGEAPRPCRGCAWLTSRRR